MLKTIKQWLNAAADVAMPRLCPVCGQALDSDERWLCRKCLASLPRTRYEEVPFNTMEQHFAGKVPIERATAYFFYEKGSPYASILHDIKYHSTPRMGQWLTTRAVGDMAASHFFDNIDAVTAVPLHRSKLAQRGYNQSEYLARGIADALHIPYIEALKAIRPHATQTRKGAMERWQNIQGNYILHEKNASQLAGKHILLVDDVITTGSTLTVCATLLKSIPNTRISLFTLAAARLE
ncbi:MAG: ComF family protein [Muribaculaceae bacterium]|nr:ComF family protein [Muribaculaceae bacterium]